LPQPALHQGFYVTYHGCLQHVMSTQQYHARRASGMVILHNLL
jgi:hypothetical protein